MSIEINAAFEDLQEILGSVKGTEPALKKATVSALNKTIVSERAEAVRLIRKDFNVKASDVRNALTISKANAGRLEARMFGDGSPGIPLYDFSPAPKSAPSTRRRGKGYTPAKGISVMVTKGNRKRITGAFVARMKSGHIGVFQRVEGKFTRDRKRQAISEKFGPSPIRILESDRYAIPLDDFASETLDKNMQHEAEFFLKKMAR